jgi:hypothetical protein
MVGKGVQMSHMEKKTVQIGVEKNEFRSFRRRLEKKIDFHPFWDKQKS